jgi:tight adherence protein B
MTAVLGSTLGLGLLLVISPFLWPAGRVRARRARPMTGRLRERMAQAGFGAVSIPALVAVSIIVAIAATAISFALVPVVALAIAAGIVALCIPLAIVNWRAAARRKANRVVWPDIVDHLVSAVRSGLALPDSVVSLASTGPLPTRQAFAEFESDYRLTGNFSLCLDRLKTRLADPVADRILETLRMSREVGGSELTTVLRNLASYLRQDAAIRSEVEARQSWVMNAARLGVAAPWIVLLLLASRPEAAAAYNTPTGLGLIVGGLAVSVVAYRIMLGLGKLPEEHRWFE